VACEGGADGEGEESHDGCGELEAHRGGWRGYASFAGLWVWVESVMGGEGAAGFDFLYCHSAAESASIRTTRADVAPSSSCQWLKFVFITAIQEQSPLLWFQQ
jgi:hypothetical protein